MLVAMVTVLIVLGVVVFLAVDAYILWRVFASRRSADDYGSFRVPGEINVALQAGKARLSYQEAYKAGGGEDDIDFGVPSALKVTVVSPSGATVEIKGPGFRGMGESLNTGSNWSRALIGTIEVVEPGMHTVTAGPDLPDAIEPQILVGK